jgi:hypothetical protein
MPNRRTRLDNLLKIAIEAHGGLNAWNQFESLRASVSNRRHLPNTRVSKANAHDSLRSSISRRRACAPQTTILARTEKSFVKETLWPEFLRLQKELHDECHDAVERVLRKHVFKR